jgi:ribosomal protein S18 acetylase RimI-like enzyme
MEIERTLQTQRGPVLIRQAVPADAAAFRKIRLEALEMNPEAFSADLETNQAQPYEYWVDRLEKLGPEHGNMLYFAEGPKTGGAEEPGPRLVGLTGVFLGNTSKTRHSATIYSVFVEPEWRGLGIAGALLESCLDWAKSQNVSVVRLGVNATNVAAIRCYARIGFLVYGLETQSLRVNGRDYDLLLMGKEIT